MNMPFVRLEIQGMKQTIVQAMHKQMIHLDADITAAVEEVCTPENVRRVVDEHIAQAMMAVIREEVEKFFRQGPGRGMLAIRVAEYLSKGVMP